MREKSNAELTEEMASVKGIVNAHLEDCTKHRGEVRTEIQAVRDYQLADKAKREARQQESDRRHKQLQLQIAGFALLISSLILATKFMP